MAQPTKKSTTASKPATPRKKPAATTAKKKVAATAPAKKATVTKKAPTKRASKAPAGHQSLHLERSREDFLAFRITRQTIYWSILSIVVLILGVWIVKLQLDIQAIYDTIEFSENLVR